MNYWQRTTIIFTMVVILFFVSFKSAQALPIPTSGEEASNPLELGIEAIRQGNYEKARDAFTEVIKENKNSFLGYSNRCLNNLQLRDYVNALTDCNQALNFNSHNLETYLNRGLAFFQLGNYQAALADYNHVIEENQQDLRAYYNRGLVWFEMQQYQQAIADYNQALFLSDQANSTQQASIYNDRGLAQLMLRNIAGAITDFSQAIALDERNYRAFYNRACACHQNHDLPGAKRDFTIALEIDPEQPEVYLSRGLISYELGYFQIAFSDLKTASQQFQKQGDEEAWQKTKALVHTLQQRIKLLTSEKIV